MLASKYGLQCFDAVKEMTAVEIAGVVMPRQEYVLKYNGRNTKKMKNEIFSDVIQRCEQLDIPVYIMDKMNHSDTRQMIRIWAPELIIVSGWYHLIGKEILEIPKKGIIGLHASLLPKYRGGAPLVWQMINGEEFAGITLFYMCEGVDTGDIIGQRKVRIEDDDTIGTLYGRIGEAGIDLLRENLPLLATDTAPRRKQTGLSAQDIYPQRSPQDGIINWTETSRQIYNFVRAQTRPYPGAFTYYMKYKIMIWSCEVTEYKCEVRNSGVIVDIVVENSASYPIVSTGDAKYGIKITDYLVLNENGQEEKMTQNLFKKGALLIKGE